MFKEALTLTYLDHTCQVLPNALWKTLPHLDTSETSFEVENGSISRLEMMNEKSLLLYWDKKRRPPHILEQNAKKLELALLHQDFFEFFPTNDFPHQEAYFRLIHHHKSIPAPTLPAGFRFAEVNLETEAALVCDLIAKCYDDLNPKEVAVRKWAQHPVYTPDLWLWVVEENEQSPVGLGIAELDNTIGEASLEWIQVLPTYRARGLAKALVLELLTRGKRRATFTTVSGRVNNHTSPERLYRRSGFTGQDVWWILRR